MASFTNDFAWSRSKAKTFRDCPRAVYYGTYKSWGGWDKSSPPAARQAYTFKNLTSVPAWTGSHVHAGIEKALKAQKRGAASDTLVDAVIREIDDDMRNEARHSSAGKYKQAPKKVVGLLDHDRGDEIDVDACVTEVATQLRQFFQSAWWTKIQSLRPMEITEVEDLVGFKIASIRSFVKIDALFSNLARPFAMVEGEVAKVHVVDWKTGRKMGADREQMALYALHAVRRYGVVPEDVVAIVYNVRLDLDRIYRFSGPELDAVSHGVRTDAEMLSEYLVDKDMERNKPLPEDQWPLAEEGSRACDWCQFKGMCPRFR